MDTVIKKESPEVTVNLQAREIGRIGGWESLFSSFSRCGGLFLGRDRLGHP